MLDSVPPEVLELIFGYLPNVASIVNVACVNKKLHATISANQYAIFRQFVQASFPSIRTPPLWQEMARQLTSRSRAWDRRAFFARECYPHTNDARGPPWLDLSDQFGYTPVIDSYEQYCGESLQSRKEVLAYGAAGQLRLRTTVNGQCRWTSHRFADDHLPQYDIWDLKLLKPSEHPERNGETLIICRADKTISKIESNPDEEYCVEVAQYVTSPSRVDCMDVGTGKDAQLAVFDKTSLKLFPLHASEDKIQPSLSTAITPKFKIQNIRRCAKFLTNETVATSVQFRAGLDRSPILVYDITGTGVVNTSLAASRSIMSGDTTITGRHSAAVLAKIDSTGSLTGRPGQVFLSGWTDGGIHLHDLRCPSQPVTSFYDPVDDGKILSLATCGHEKFFAGSSQNGCLKMFDMRMPGSRAYSYIDNLPFRKNAHQDSATSASDPYGLDIGSLDLQPKPRPRQDINIFLAVTINQKGRLWEPLPPQNRILDARNALNSGRNSVYPRNQRRRGGQQNNGHNHNYTRYRGSVYSLSTPSPSSSTLFAGIENHVIQLDFINTDDVRRRIIELPTYEPGGFSDPGSSEGLKSTEKDGIEGDANVSSIPTTTTTTNVPSTTSRRHKNGNKTNQQPPPPVHQNPILDLSCYERPRPGHEATDAVLLRKQIPFSEHRQDKDGPDDDGGDDNDLEQSAEQGWDERWRLGRSWRGRDRS